MKLKLPLVLILAGVFLLFDAQHLFAQSGSETNSPKPTNETAYCPHWHTIEIKPGPHTPRIHFYNKLNPVWWFKNSDEPTPPEWYLPNGRHRKLKWSFRNPIHNLDFYVIGVADKKFSRSGRFPEKNSDPRGGWDFEAARYKFIWLPFVAYHRPKFDFYFGWRNHGNFGIKINIGPKRKADSQPQMSLHRLSENTQTGYGTPNQPSTLVKNGVLLARDDDSGNRSRAACRIGQAGSGWKRGVADSR